MKAERRHELQSNTLALWLRWRAPEIWAKHGSRILLALVLVALAIVLIHRRIKAPEDAANLANNNLENARGLIARYNDGMLNRDAVREALVSIDAALGISDRPEIQAEALVLRGDYHFIIAGRPLDLRSTQPATPALPSREAMESARRSYEAALVVPDAPPDLRARAHIGLASIAETRAFDAARQAGWKDSAEIDALWAEAERHFRAVAEATDVPAPVRDEALWRMEQLVQLKQPIWVAPSTAPVVPGITDSIFMPDPLLNLSPLSPVEVPPAPVQPSAPAQPAPLASEPAP